MTAETSRDPGPTNTPDGTRPPEAVESRLGPLPASGGWAEVRTLITFGVRRRVMVALAHRVSADPEERSRAEAEVIVAMVTAWGNVGPDGNELGLTLEGIDEMDPRDADAIFERAVAAYRYGTRPIDPKAAGS